MREWKGVGKGSWPDWRNALLRKCFSLPHSASRPRRGSAPVEKQELSQKQGLPSLCFSSSAGAFQSTHQHYTETPKPYQQSMGQGGDSEGKEFAVKADNLSSVSETHIVVVEGKNLLLQFALWPPHSRMHTNINKCLQGTTFCDHIHFIPFIPFLFFPLSLSDSPL